MTEIRAGNTTLSRRRFLRQAGTGAIAAGVLVATPLPAAPARRMRRVAALSDIHIGVRARGRDGARWLARALDDLDSNIGAIDFGLTLGDITHDGDSRSLQRYLELRDRSRIQRWFEIAGNHEHHRDGIANYRQLIGRPEPYLHADGNVVWIFLPDESRHRSGELSSSTRTWLREQLERHRQDVIILCSHQSPPDTVRRSAETGFCLHPRREISAINEEYPIALHLCGHEHHRPYDEGCICTSNGGVVINVASVNHAYETDESGSWILELEEGSDEIVARRRSHDRRRYRGGFEVRVPLPTSISLATPSRRRDANGRRGVLCERTEYCPTRPRRIDPRP